MALRLGVGWHFYHEGATKLREGDFSSAGFFQNAQGPLAPIFWSMIWDADGRLRLDQELTEHVWAQHRQRVADHFRFSDEQRGQAERVWDRRRAQLDHFFAQHAEELEQYFLGLERRDAHYADAAQLEVPSLAQQAARVRTELVQQRSGWLQELDRLWAGYERDLNALATPEQQRRGQLRVAKPGQGWMSASTIDRFLPWFTLIIGACLFLGLLTRFAALAGSGFLAMVIATQWPPWAPGTLPVFDQVIEMLALLVLAAVGAGRFAGLDQIFWGLRQWCCPPKTGTRS